MAIVPGVRFGPYVVAESIGSGGMGEVYRATDTNLKRDVALKVLPQPLSIKPNGLARFRREAEILASLNHPNIAQLYGVEKNDVTTALVMELVEGPTLAHRIARGPLPPSEALSVALQIAAALEAAHSRGIVHRDLKPDNIKVRPDGVVKVLDFGIARALDAKTGEDSAKRPATPAITETGVVLGTTAYMSPEQLRGMQVDERADIWAFGCVLYELLAGQAAFPGEAVAPLAHEPDMGLLPKSVPPNVCTTIELCLKKDLQERIADIRDVRLALKGTFESGQHMARSPAVAAPPWRRALPLAAALVAGGILAGAYVWRLTPATTSAPVSRFVVTPPLGTRLTSVNDSDIAISPNGRELVYYASVPDAPRSPGGPRPTASLYLRELDALDSRVIPGSSIEGLEVFNMKPFFSADGKSIGFWLPGRGLVSVPLDGGAMQYLLEARESSFDGAAWLDNTLVFSSGRDLRRMVVGGTPEVLTGEAQPDTFFAAPVFLPGGRAVLYTVSVGADERVAVLDLATRESKILIEDGTTPSFASTGHIVFARGNTLLAVPFDATRLAVTGPAVTVLVGVRHPGPGRRTAADYALSATGTLVYVPDDGVRLSNVPPVDSELLWVDRNGRVIERAVSEPVASAQNPRLSPDGKRLALGVGWMFDAGLWIYDLGGRPGIPLVTDRRAGMSVWSPDGAQLALSASVVGGPSGVYTVAADVGSEPKLLRAAAPFYPLMPEVWTTGGELLLVAGQRDIQATSATSQGELRDVVATEAREFHPALSPNGRWLAYASNRSGEDEIWVKEYPDGAGAVRVSGNGGYAPTWAANGRELFYLSPKGAMMSVAVETELDFTFRPPVELFDESFMTVPVPSVRFYDVAPDGRFLMIRRHPVNAPDSLPQRPNAADASVNGVVVVENWFEELERLVPN